ncbi:MAG: hypothetical protein KJO54_03365 [Gammaproteobacteria bacterium]|nr:hypothetical protein [Gammaproteobacteria bacterium]NNF61792.1 hypothetical protein [Gammaproteobacteria bacterium]NNM19716.1 hypothetical protein [Gammaproteobacteria bacterium]
MTYWKYLLATVITGLVLVIAGCSTTKGIGEDVEQLGENIQEEVDEHD